MSFVGIIEHNGKELIIVDISHCQPKESVQLINDAILLVKARAKKSVRLLTNVQDTVYDKDVFPALKDFVVSNIPYIMGSAVVGIDGVKKAIFNTVKFITTHEIRQFNTDQEAMDWLASL